MNNRSNEFNPDYTSPPGETLEEVLEDRGMTQVDLAQRIGMSRKHVKNILEGASPITPETALKLERVFNIPAHFWNNLEQYYRAFLARKEEERLLNKSMAWLSNFKHTKKMVELRWIPQTEASIEKLRALLGFFGVTSPEVWDAHWSAVGVRYRRSEDFDKHALAAWLRRGELQALQMKCEPYDETRFRATLKQIRSLTKEAPETFCPKLVDLCSRCGVAVVFVPELPKTASGATRWIAPNKALIQLSLRYKTDDHLWFTFFHEAGHILLHAKKDIFIESAGAESKEEDEANTFAAESLIPRSELNAFAASRSIFSKAAIDDFARRQGIAPGIVVGQLQHTNRLPYSHCNELKKRFEWGIPK